MTPDYQTAAIKATETLIQYKIGTAPVDPLPILKRIPGVLVLSFEEMSQKANAQRKDILDMFGCKNQDAVTTCFDDGKNLRYIVSYNKMLSSNIADRALARELGHIILGHNGTKPEDVREEEARCFAHHLLCPRPLIHMIMSNGIRLSTEVLGSVTGCYDHCLTCMRKQPAVHVPPELNRAVRDQFTAYALNFFEFQRYATLRDDSATADIGLYMEGYEE